MAASTHREALSYPRGRAHQHALVDLFSARKRVVLALLIVCWALGTVVFLGWLLRADHLHGGGVVTLFNVALLIFDAAVLPAWFFFFAWRARRPDTDQPDPPLRAAIIVTRAPSEPWPMVRETVEAMLGQQTAGIHDVWLADERPTDEIRAWCRARGVHMSTRDGVRDYHQAQWPRRARCKEGNLAFFYDFFGYRRYDVVAQLDADHVPARDYLKRMLAPFADPRVGYVAAPSICDRNAETSWSARGRLWVEGTLHGIHQAGCHGAWAPSCIGSHYAVRTEALGQAGGIGPELAEDFSTTLALNSAGWRGVFAIDAEAHGEGPETFGDCMTQEFQWARSMTNVMLRHARSRWSTLAWQAKLRLGFCLAWYPLLSITMLSAVLLPGWALLSGQPPLTVSLGDFFSHALAPVGVMLAAVYWLSAQGLLRPRDARPLSWEGVLYLLLRWPWSLLGQCHAVIGQLSGREVEFRITPKGNSDARPMALGVIAPYLVLGALSLLPLAIVTDPGPAGGYRFWAIVNALIYFGASGAVVLLHGREQRRYARGFVLGHVFRISLPAVGLATALVAFALSANRPGLPENARADAGHFASALTGYDVGDGLGPQLLRGLAPSTPPRVTLGVTTPRLLRSGAAEWKPTDLGEVDRFEQSARRQAGIVMWFANWARSEPNVAQLRTVAARGSVPEITWEPWDPRLGSRRQPRFSLSGIAAGRHDEYVRRWAEAMRAYGRPVRLRFAHEVNGSWYPWSETPRMGNPRGSYVAAWRHIYRIFAAVGATNVVWVWSPISAPTRRSQYPGDRFVDVIGLTGFNGGSKIPRWGGWRSFREVFADGLDVAKRFAPDKPVEISEVSTTEAGGDKAAWITEMFRTLRQFPQVRAVVWFDARKQADWRLNTSPAARRAFAAGVANPRFGESQTPHANADLTQWPRLTAAPPSGPLLDP